MPARGSRGVSSAVSAAPLEDGLSRDPAPFPPGGAVFPSFAPCEYIRSALELLIHSLPVTGMMEGHKWFYKHNTK